MQVDEIPVGADQSAMDTVCLPPGRTARPLHYQKYYVKFYALTYSCDVKQSLKFPQCFTHLRAATEELC